MSFPPYLPHYAELLVPSAETEQEFLLLAVHAAVKKYRASEEARFKNTHVDAAFSTSSPSTSHH